VNKIAELDKLTKAIADAEIHLKSIQMNIEGVDKEIAVLSPRKTELEQNLSFHKQANTVPIAHEYKKAKTELAQVKTRLNAITSDRTKAIQACTDIELIIDKFKRNHYELLKTSENNILRVIFGGKRGKE
jgi:predicted  nucleic acid-binding Zn-ribbon protein